MISCATPAPETAPRAPRIVVISIDDLGYADIGPYGGEIPTPNLDRMAREGVRFTDFSVSSAVCSASRAALLTGCYHQRIGIAGALGPRSQIGLSDEETTLAGLCKTKGYATACFGKWHLGHHPRFLPTRHGFDEYFGLPYSNDMWPQHPDYARLPNDAAERKRGYPSLPLIEGERVVDPEVTGAKQAQLTRLYTERAISFIDRHKDEPFFLYVPHTMVHVPLFVSEPFAGRSGRGLFGDAIMEIDWSVGEILSALQRNGIDSETLVVFTSDNGPWLSYGDHAGSSGPLREGKGTMFEGGIRVPMIARWPGMVPAGATCDQFAATIDLLPTVATLIGAEVPSKKIDGRDITPLLLGQPGAQSPDRLFCCYYAGGQLQAVRNARWKLHFPHEYATLEGRKGGSGGSPVPYGTRKIGLALYDLREDPGETKDVAAEHPDVVRMLEQLADQARQDLGDSLRGVQGLGVRQPGRIQPGDQLLDVDPNPSADPPLRAAREEGRQARPNIVLIIADDLGFGDLGCYGQEKIQTPRLDRMAAEGMRFTHFYSAAPVCAPSRGALLTGLHTGHAFIRDNREVKPEGQLPLPPETRTLAKLLRDAGYHTALSGKWGLGGPGSTGEPLDQGFDRFFGYLCQREAHNYFPDHLWRDRSRVQLEGNSRGITGRHYAHDLITTDALDFLSSRHDRPFFLTVAYTIPHVALQVPEDSLSEYKGRLPDEPYDGKQGYLPHDHPHAAYAAMVSRMDRDVGRILDMLKERKIDRDTLILFTSDNGPTHGRVGGADSAFFRSTGGLRGMKGSVHEGGLRVPLLAFWPGRIEAGQMTDTPSAGYDLMPTILDVTGSTSAPGLDGRSLAPILLGKAKSLARDVLFWSFPGYGGQCAVRFGDIKAVRKNLLKNPNAPIEIYDLKKDPAETTDIASERPDLVKRARELMAQEHRASAEFPLPGLDR